MFQGFSLSDPSPKRFMSAGFELVLSIRNLRLSFGDKRIALLNIIKNCESLKAHSVSFSSFSCL